MQDDKLNEGQQKTCLSSSNSSPKLDKNGNHLTTSQEENLSRSSFITPNNANNSNNNVVNETLTLKDGKIVTSSTSCTISTGQDSADQQDKSGIISTPNNRTGPPNHPVPPPPTSSSGNSLCTVVKVDVRHTHAKSDYANFSLLINHESDSNHSDTSISKNLPLSSFKPPLPLPNESEAGLSEATKTSITDSKKNGDLKSEILTEQELTTSLTRAVPNTFQPSVITISTIDGRISDSTVVKSSHKQSSQTFIPEPDYSDGEENGYTSGKVTGSDLSTFKRSALPTTTTVQPVLASNKLPDSSMATTSKMSQSYQEDSPKDGKTAEKRSSFSSTAAPESGSPRDNSIRFETELRNKVQNLAVSSTSKSGAISKLVERDTDKLARHEANSQPRSINTNGESVGITESVQLNSSETQLEPKSEPLNKVKESIKAFERRSSTSTELSTGASSITSYGTIKTAKSSVSNTSPESLLFDPANNTDSGGSSALRMSKSCFEVDVCDSSSGVSSDIDGDGGRDVRHHHVHHHDASSASYGKNISANSSCITASNVRAHTLATNRRNSAIVSEKIACLMSYNSTMVSNYKKAITSFYLNNLHPICIKKN